MITNAVRSVNSAFLTLLIVGAIDVLESLSNIYDYASTRFCLGIDTIASNLAKAYILSFYSQLGISESHIRTSQKSQFSVI
jgi:hypothetical protein